VSDGVISVAQGKVFGDLDEIVKNAVKATDQYGVEEQNDTYQVIVTNFVAANGITTLYDFKTGTQLAAGDKFNITAVANGKTIQFKVITVQ
ncbi:MAG TPA: hypothetical protein GXX14_12980, partial [Clostridiaceae bacterium]|nr:hypothetical protein [Clostridiaceae bacterium]